MTTEKWSDNFWLIVLLLFTVQGSVLYYLGQPIISRTGGIRLWCGDPQDKENSQHIADWYTFSHIIHGILFYWILGLVLPNSSLALRFLLSMILEIMWEIAENTPMVINRYRQSALANGYSGDSILNSVCDTLSMSFGFYLAKSLPLYFIVVYVVFTELLCAYKIRDNLTLNVIQLIHPMDSISRWQTNIWVCHKRKLYCILTHIYLPKNLYGFFVFFLLFRSLNIRRIFYNRSVLKYRPQFTKCRTSQIF